MPDTRLFIRVLCADDHPLMREGIAALLSGRADMALVGEATDGREAVALYRQLMPDVVLMDLSMPVMNGLEAITAIRADFPAARIIVLTTYPGDAPARAALKAGAQAYVLKSLARRSLVEAIVAVHEGRRVLSPEVEARLGEHTAATILTGKEVEILQWVAVGTPNRAIATRLAITEGTVKGHLKSILSKLDARDRTHAVTIALERGFIELVDE
jgi:DNA-binding NarL/FixJ family response regulator